MKICYISDLYSPYAVGGAETYLDRLVNEISKQAEVVVITTVPKYCSLPEVVKEGRVTFYRLAAKPLYSILEYSKRSSMSRCLWQVYNLWNPYSYRNVRKCLAVEKPDIVHTHNFKGFSPSIFSAIRSGQFSHVHTVHDYNLISPWSNLMRGEELIKDFSVVDKSYMKYLRYATRSMSAVIFPSNFALQLHREQGFFSKSRTLVIPNGVPLVSHISSRPSDTVNLLYVGTLAFYKGVHVLLRAFMHCSNPNIRLHIVGEGSDGSRLRKIAENDTRITFYGRVSDVILEDLYQTSNFFVMPSLWFEVLPVVIQESMAHGLPVVGSAIGGIIDLIIDGYNGYLFKPGDHNSLAQIIQSLSSSPEKLAELSGNSTKFIKGFDMSTHVNSLLTLYHTVTN